MLRNVFRVDGRLKNRLLGSLIEVNHVDSIKFVVHDKERSDFKVKAAVRSQVVNYVVILIPLRTVIVQPETLRTQSNILQKQLFKNLILKVIHKVDPAIYCACKHMSVIEIVFLFAFLHSNYVCNRFITVWQEHGLLINQCHRKTRLRLVNQDFTDHNDAFWLILNT